MEKVSGNRTAVDVCGVKPEKTNAAREATLSCFFALSAPGSSALTKSCSTQARTWARIYHPPKTSLCMGEESLPPHYKV